MEDLGMIESEEGEVDGVELKNKEVSKRFTGTLKDTLVLE